MIQIVFFFFLYDCFLFNHLIHSFFFCLWDRDFFLFFSLICNRSSRFCFPSWRSQFCVPFEIVILFSEDFCLCRFRFFNRTFHFSGNSVLYLHIILKEGIVVIIKFCRAWKNDFNFVNNNACCVFVDKFVRFFYF